MRSLLATLLVGHLVTGELKPPSVFISVLVVVITFIPLTLLVGIFILLFTTIALIIITSTQVRNKAHTLPYFLSLLEQLRFPKNRIILHIRSDLNEVPNENFLDALASLAFKLSVTEKLILSVYPAVQSR